MRRHAIGLLLAAGSSFAVVAASGCQKPAPAESSYFSRSIAPILTNSCVRTNTGAACHVADDKGNAFGNLDLSTYAETAKRRDLLTDYGPYGQPALLLKNVLPLRLDLIAFDGTKTPVTTDLRHTGGPILDATATGYRTLRQWIAAGATENNVAAPPANAARTPCTEVIPSAVSGSSFDPASDPSSADFATFRDRVAPVLRASCAAGNCHGNQANELSLTCGDSPAGVRWNYFAASQYVGPSPEASEILRRPLAPEAGGAYHEGGIVFATAADPGYRAIQDWATAHGPTKHDGLDPNFVFFARRIQPVLAKKGCMMQQCHSAAEFHDLRLRGGSGGSFSYQATAKNYEIAVLQLALESNDVIASRLVQKNLYRADVVPGSRGVAHRGGPLFEDFGKDGASGAACDGKGFDYDGGSLDGIPAFCMVREWHRRERATRNLGPLSSVVYVKRALSPGFPSTLDFDVYSPGADLRVATVMQDPATLALSVSADASLLDKCGLQASSSDVRRPEASPDGAKVAFAARASAGDPLRIYEIDLASGTCGKLAGAEAGSTTDHGLLVHDFDPAYGPKGADGRSPIVFASTRGRPTTVTNTDVTGAARQAADPTKPNADLFVLEGAPGGGSRVRQLTFLLDLERQPSFMADGRILFVAEKRAKDFYQLAIRRMNLDGSDYHPLVAQRGSIGAHEAHDAVELASKEFAAILSDPGAAHAGGALVLVNRSLGVDFTSHDPADYPVDPSVIDPASKSAPEPTFFLHSTRALDPAVSGSPGKPTAGLYAWPAALPDGRILVSFGAAADAKAFGGDYDLYVVDPATGGKTRLFGDAGSAEGEAIAIYPHATRALFHTPFEEPNGFASVPSLAAPDPSASADITYLDVPLLASLLFQNTPTGRLVDPTIRVVSFWEALPPGSSSPPPENVATDKFGSVFVKRRLLGTAPLREDGSLRVRLPGGVPVVIELPARPNASLPRAAREAFSFAPGEVAHQSFRRDLFDGLCAQCHGAISGRPVDVAVRPDILTGASAVLAAAAEPFAADGPPTSRSSVEGPASP